MSTAALVGWGGHDPELRDADVQAVVMDCTERVRVRLLEAIDSHAPLVVWGPYGSGKTFAAARACEHALDLVDADVRYLRLPKTSQGRGLYRAILEQLLTQPVSSGLTETQLMYDLNDVLTERERILVIDETHRMSRGSQEALQNLVDLPGTLATFVLLGDETMPRALLPELWSRAGARVEFHRLADDEAVGVLAEMHPLFAASDPDLLRRLNRRFARGELRRWAKLLARALRYDIGTAIELEHVDVLCEDH